MAKFEISANQLKNDLQKEIEKLDWKEFHPMVLDEKPIFTDLFTAGKGSSVCGGAVAVTNMDTLYSTFFIDAILKLFCTPVMKFIMGDSVVIKLLRILHLAKSPETIYARFVHQLVVHENRHCHQLHWLMEKSKDLAEKVYAAEQKSFYGNGAMEKDAYKYQMSEKHVPFEEVFKDFLEAA
jgi:hypothetical protein